ncbi:uncharacterized protein [Argopecten irradians]|uniref:uncharacterized protein n=1 Tax=Argopecten irradians TaxID=31199 RepID=UPI003711ECF8
MSSSSTLGPAAYPAVTLTIIEAVSIVLSGGVYVCVCAFICACVASCCDKCKTNMKRKPTLSNKTRIKRFIKNSNGYDEEMHMVPLMATSGRITLGGQANTNEKHVVRNNGNIQWMGEIRKCYVNKISTKKTEDESIRRCKTITNISGQTLYGAGTDICGGVHEYQLVRERAQISPFSQIKSKSNFVGTKDPETPPTDILKGQWKIRQNICMQNLNVSIETSTVKLSFSKDNFKNGQDSSFSLCGSVHTDLRKLLQCIEIEDDRMLVSPVPEFHIGRSMMLYDYAITEIPLCVPVHSPSLKVHCMETDDSNLKTIDVPFQKYPHMSSLDIFYIIPKDRHTCVHVYSRHFCVFYCTVCNEDVPFQMEAEVYAREGSFEGFPTVHIKMPLLGPYEMLEDCREERKKSMEEVNFKRIDRGKIKTLESKIGTALKFCLKSPLNWDHDTDREGVIFQQEQFIDETPSIKCISKRHHLQDDGAIQWKIKCKEPYRGTIAFTIDVTNFSTSDHRDSKISRFRPEFEVKCPSGRACEPGILNRNVWPQAGREPLGSLVKGLQGENIRKNLLQRMGHTSPRNFPCTDEFLYDTLSSIQRKDSISFLTNIRMSLEEMHVPINEDILCFFLNVCKSGEVSDRTKTAKRKEQIPFHDDSDETRPKTIDYRPKSDDNKRCEPLGHDEIQDESTAVKIPNGTSTVGNATLENGHQVINNFCHQVQTKPELESRGEPSGQETSDIGATGGGLQWV